MTYLSSNGGFASPVSDTHSNVGRVDNAFLSDRMLEISNDSEIDFIRYRFVGEVVLASDGEAHVGSGDDLVVVLKDHLLLMRQSCFSIHEREEIDGKMGVVCGTELLTKERVNWGSSEEPEG